MRSVGVGKELVENGNGKAEFDFSLITAFRVVEKVTDKYFEEGFGTENIQENQDNIQETPKKSQGKAKEKLVKN